MSHPVPPSKRRDWRLSQDAPLPWAYLEEGSIHFRFAVLSATSNQVYSKTHIYSKMREFNLSHQPTFVYTFVYAMAIQNYAFTMIVVLVLPSYNA